MHSVTPNPHPLQTLHYDLPKELIASKPVEPRDASRLLCLNKVSGKIEHHAFSELPSLLREGDVLVRNASKVIPARLFGTKLSGGRVEVLLNRLLDPGSNTWECLLRPGLKTQTVLNFGGGISGEVYKDVRDIFTFNIKFNCDIDQFYFFLHQAGHVPLPPYIPNTDQQSENYWRSVYQTTFAKADGSVAAPTAGLHFTPKLDALLKAKGVQIEEIVLHVGLGTFAPIKSNDYTKHHLHTEDFLLDVATAKRINNAKHEGRRIIAVGTTTVRVLEHCAVKIPHPTHAHQPTASTPDFQLQPQTGSTDIFIYPPYRFKMVDALITNFHLPETSLLLLISAFVSQPNTTYPFTTFLTSTVGHAYVEAIQEKYRFFSFGDAMLVE